MSLKKPTFVDVVLDELYNFAAKLPRPFEAPYQHSKRLRGFDPGKYRRTVRDLHKRGLVEILTKHDEKFIELTSRGVLEALLKKAKIKITEKWDGKWRLVMFDIPESSKPKRRLFRVLLLQNGFKKLQASVYISPYPLNRSALDYLRQTGLIGYVRIMRVDDLDDDTDIKKKFNLNK